MKKMLVCSIAVFFAAGILFAGGRANTKTSEGGDVPRVVFYSQQNPNYEPTPPDVLAKIKNKILADTGIELDYIMPPMDGNDRNARLNLLLSSNEPLDIWQDAWEPLQNSRRIADLTDVVSKSTVLQDVFGDTFNAMKTPDGKIWGIPRNCDANHYPLWIRKDWLTKLNLQVPTTIEEYEKVLEAFGQLDPAGGGRTVPLLLDEMPVMPLLGGFTENGGGVYKAPDGKIYPYFMDPGYKDMLAKVNEWYNKRYMNLENFIMDGSQRIDLIRQGRVGSFMGWYSRITLNWEIMRSVVPEAEFIYIPLKGPKGFITTVNAYARYSFGSSGGTGSYVVNSRTKDLDAVIKIFEWGCGDISNNMSSRFGLENEGWRWVDKQGGIFTLTGAVSGRGLEYGHLYMGPVIERYAKPDNSANQRHDDYLFGYFKGQDLGDFSGSKYPADGGIHFDAAALMAAAPNQADMARVVTEESVKFVTGARPLSDYNNFLNDINRIGMDVLSAELTRQFNAASK